MNRTRVFQAALITLAIIRLNLELMSVFLYDTILLLAYLLVSGDRKLPAAGKIFPGLTGFGMVGDFLSKTKDKADMSLLPEGSERFSGRVLRILKEERICTLQKRIAAKYFSARFGITPGDRDLQILSRFGDLRLLGRMLQAGAGSGRNNRNDEFLYRCRVVYPAFIKGLGLKLAYEGVKGESDSNRLPILKKIKLGIIRMCCSIRQIYPEGLDRYKERLEEEKIQEEGRKKRLGLYLQKEAGRFEIYLSCLVVLMDRKDHKKKALIRLLNKLSGIKINEFEGDDYE